MKCPSCNATVYDEAETKVGNLVYTLHRALERAAQDFPQGWFAKELGDAEVYLKEHGYIDQDD